LAQRPLRRLLVRATGTICDAGIVYEVPQAADLPGRLQAAPAIVYRIVTEGYSTSSGDKLVREHFGREALALPLLRQDRYERTSACTG
jgi:RNA polymerase sigma-70 factor, ECF subfamily